MNTPLPTSAMLYLRATAQPLGSTPPAQYPRNSDDAPRRRKTDQPQDEPASESTGKPVAADNAASVLAVIAHVTASLSNRLPGHSPEIVFNIVASAVASLPPADATLSRTMAASLDAIRAGRNPMLPTTGPGLPGSLSQTMLHSARDSWMKRAAARQGALQPTPPPNR